MILLEIIFIGWMATLAMTLFMRLCDWISPRNLNVINILSNMLPGVLDRSKEADPVRYKPLAIIVHYGIGIFFVLCYHLWRITEGNAGDVSVTEPWILGFILGTIGVAGWVLFLRVHPAPLPTVPWEIYLVCIFIGHIIFAFAMKAGYQYLEAFKLN